MDAAVLIERARRGDEDAFSLLYRRCQPAVYRYAAYIAGVDAADDVVQETFLALLRQRERRDVPRDAKAYLLGIARHVALKGRARRSEDPPDEGIGDVDRLPDETHLTLEAGLARAESVERVRAAVRSLPAPYREVVVLCELQELEYAEAAALIGCPIGTVRSRLNRARALLATKLAAVAEVAPAADQ